MKEITVDGNRAAAEARAKNDYFTGGGRTASKITIDTKTSRMSVIVRSQRDGVLAIYWHN